VNRNVREEGENSPGVRAAKDNAINAEMQKSNREFWGFMISSKSEI
jgi:hypothetical protein